MRAILLACILAIGLVALPLAVAARNEHAVAAAGEHGQPAAKDEAKTNATNSTHKPSWLADLLAGMKDVRDGCHAQKADHRNMSGEENRSWGQCIRNGYRSLFESLHLGRYH